MSHGILRLRPYQREAVDATAQAWARGMRRPAEVMPTGAGKTVVFAHLGLEAIQDRPAERVLVIAHTTELVNQAVRKFRDVAPGLQVGVVQAERNETLARVIVGSVQTLRSETRLRMLRNVGTVIVDEAHHAVAVSYRSVLNWFGALGEPVNRSGGAAARAVGFTATMSRADDLALGDVWQDVVFVRTIAEMITDGYLVRPRGLHVRVDDLDLSKVKSTAGDYNAGQLGQALEESMAPEAIAKAVAEHAPDRKIVVFAPTVSSAAAIGEALSASGRPAALIHGAMPAGERAAVLGAFAADSVRILVNCMVLTEGFDEPSLDCVVIARPTRSRGLYTQMVGRGLRPWPGKSDALVLDVVGATRVHGLQAGIELFGEAVLRTEKDQSAEDTGDDLEDPDELDDGQQDLRAALDGPLVATEVDLFAASPMQWLRTRAGVFFIPAGERYIAIYPARPRTQDQWLAHFAGQRGGLGYDVVQMDKNKLHSERMIVEGVEDLSYAMAWAEGDVSWSEKMTASKERSWRARPVSDKMKHFAARLKLYIPPGARAGEVSTMITVALATQRIDGHLPDYLR